MLRVSRPVAIFRVCALLMTFRMQNAASSTGRGNIGNGMLCLCVLKTSLPMQAAGFSSPAHRYCNKHKDVF